MIDAMFQAGTDAALDDQLRRARPVPTAEPAGFSFAQLAKAPFQGIGSGVSKSIAFGAEVLGAFGDVAGTLPGVADTPEQRRQQEEARQKLLKEGPSFSNEAGDTFRRRSAEIMPDPATTHVSAQVLAGMSEFMTQAAGYTVAGGPVVGPTLLAGDVGLAEADKLKQQGVDLKTRAQAGAVAGVVAGASTVIPLHGASALSRFAKGAAVGEAGIVGQTTAERLILQHGGYDKIADTYDPLDPVALGVGMIPGVLGAAMGRAPARPIKSVRTQAELRDATALTPAEQARSAAYEASDANLAELRAAVAAEKNPANRATLQAELDRQTAAAAEMRTRAAVEQQPDLIRSARVLQTADALEASRLTPDTDLAGRDAHVRAVEMAGDQIAAGEAVRVAEIVDEHIITAAQREQNFRAWFGDSKVVDEQGRPRVMYHGTAENFDAFGADESVNNMRGMLKWMKDDKGNWVERPQSEMLDGRFFFTDHPRLAADYAEGQNLHGENAAVMPVYLSLKNPLIVDANGLRGKEKFDFVEKSIGDAIDGKHDGLVMRNVVDALANDPDMFIEPTTVAVAFRRSQIKSAIGNSGRFDPNSGSLTDPIVNLADALAQMKSAGQREAKPAAAAPVDSRARPAIDAAQRAQAERGGKPLQQFLADSPQRPEVQNLLVGMERAKDDAARARMLDEFDRAARSDTNTPLHDLAADVVDRMGEKQPAEATALDRAAADVAALNPDLMVEVEGREPMRVADLLKAVKREAADDAADARLLEVAAQCALRH